MSVLNTDGQERKAGRSLQTLLDQGPFQPQSLELISSAGTKVDLQPSFPTLVCHFNSGGCRVTSEEGREVNWQVTQR